MTAYSKKIFLVFTLFIFAFSSPAQIPAPRICAVSVDTLSGYPVIYWTVDDTSALDGFIIKRIIYDGTGVVSGTLNNIAVIDNPSDSIFTDTVTVYQTTAKPWLRSETYVVASYTDDSGTVHYSGFSNYMKTIFLKSSMDFCGGNINLTWNNPGTTVSQYEIWLNTGTGFEQIASTTDTFFVYTPDTAGTHLFRIEAITPSNCYIKNIFSNTDTLNLQTNIKPYKLYIESIQAVSEGLEIKLDISPGEHTPKIQLIRDGEPIADFHEAFYGNFEDNTTTDEIHTYKLISLDLCNNEFYESNIARNIVLKGSTQTNDNRSNNLQWNKYDYWAGQTGYYEILSGYDSTNLNVIYTTNDTTFTHDLSGMIKSTSVRPDIYYRIIAYEKNNPSGKNAISKSNILRLEQPPLVFVPNAINPYSQIEEERFVRVYCDFYDSFEMIIKDLNGRIIFRSNTPDKYWYGTLPDGSPAPQGAYIYLIRIKASGKTYKFKGYINLLKRN